MDMWKLDGSQPIPGWVLDYAQNHPDKLNLFRYTSGTYDGYISDKIFVFELTSDCMLILMKNGDIAYLSKDMLDDITKQELLKYRYRRVYVEETLAWKINKDDIKNKSYPSFIDKGVKSGSIIFAKDVFDPDNEDGYMCFIKYTKYSCDDKDSYILYDIQSDTYETLDGESFRKQFKPCICEDE